MVLREAVLANQNLSKWSISDMEGKSWGVLLLLGIEGLMSKINGSVSSNRAVSRRTNETEAWRRETIIFSWWETKDPKRRSTIFPSLLFKIVIKYSAKQEKATSGIVFLMLFLGNVFTRSFFLFSYLRWFLRNKSYRWIFLKLSWMFSTKHCFEKYNKNDRSPFSFKRCDGPILPYLCLYSC